MRRYKIDNEIVFGSAYKKIDTKDLKKFEINLTCEMNVLRHFREVDSKYLKTIVGGKYSYYDHDKKKLINSIVSMNNIRASLKIKGTKFFENVSGIENPRKLFNLVKKQFEKKICNKNIGWVYGKNKRVARFSFTYKSFVGEEDLALISTLSEADKKRVKKIPRGKSSEKLSFVNVVSGIKKKKTKIISVKIVEMKELSFYSVTAYPRGNGSDCGESYFGSKEVGDFLRKRFLSKGLSILGMN